LQAGVLVQSACIHCGWVCGLGDLHSNYKHLYGSRVSQSSRYTCWEDLGPLQVGMRIRSMREYGLGAGVYTD